MMMKLFYYNFIFLIALSNFACSSKLVNVKLQVIDEDNLAVENARVDMGFLLSHGGNRFSGLTDAAGYIEAAEYGTYGQKIIINKDGYYQSKIRTGYGDQNLSMLLRKKKNPIAMYARQYQGEIPGNGQPAGFDFIAGDWVAPFGKGSNSHVFFTYTGSAEDFFNFKAKLLMSFPNDKDGYQPVDYPEGSVSEFHLPYMAPLTHYIPVLECDIQGSKSAGSNYYTYDMDFNSSEDSGYFLRVNTQLDNSGNIVQANYVKIKKDIVFRPYRLPGKNKNSVIINGSINFTYYYNPVANDRNVEFDPQRNLLINLKPEERVRTP